MALPTSTLVYGKDLPNNTVSNLTSKFKKRIGFKYPIEENPKRGYFSKETGLALDRNNLATLIKTEKGERFMLPNYGCSVTKYLMEPLDDATFAEVKKEIYDGITTYLSKISISKLQIFEDSGNTVRIELFCTTRDEDSVTFQTTINL